MVKHTTMLDFIKKASVKENKVAVAADIFIVSKTNAPGEMGAAL
jgi:hypothetical protein